MLAVDNLLATGAASSALPRSVAVPFGELNSLFGTNMSGWVSRSQIESALLSSGNGTRAVIYGMDANGIAAHVWNAVVQRGQINYIDGQICGGGAVNFKNFQYLRFGILK